MATNKKTSTVPYVNSKAAKSAAVTNALIKAQPALPSSQRNFKFGLVTGPSTISKAAAKAPAKTAAKTTTPNPGVKTPATHKAATPAPVAKKTATPTTTKKTTSTSTPAASTSNTLDQVATMQNGLTPSSTYTPVDLSGLLNTGTFDPSSTSSLFDAQYKQLQGYRDNQKANYTSGDSKLAQLYANLSDSINQTAKPITAAYTAAANNDTTNGNTASAAIADAGTALANQRSAMLSNLGIQAAAPGLAAADTATLQGQTKVQQAAGLESNLAALLGANANAAIRSNASNALQAGNEQRSNLLSEYNDDSATLDSKQADLDSAKAQAIANAQSAFNTAQSSAQSDYIKYAMQNATNASTAATAANKLGQSTTSMLLNNQNDTAKLTLAQQAEAAKEAQNNAANALAQQKINASSTASTLSSKLSSIGTSSGMTKQQVSNSIIRMQNLLSNGKTYKNAAEFTAALQKSTNNSKLNVALANLANQYWKSNSMTNSSVS